jgi:hypothetical protein
VRVPQEAAEGKTRLTVSFTDYRGLASPTNKEAFKVWGVAPAVVEFPIAAKPELKKP